MSSGIERAKATRREIERRRANLEGRDRKLMDLIKSIRIEEEHNITIEEIHLISHVYMDNALNAGYDFFKYGFYKGQEYERSCNHG